MALQEVRSDLREFSGLKRILGPDWDFVATDVPDGAPGNAECMIFLYNIRHVQFRNIAGELTLKEGGKIPAGLIRPFSPAVRTQAITGNEEAVYRAESDNGLEASTKYDTWRTYKMSDHLPMWVELQTDFRDEYLEMIESGET